LQDRRGGVRPCGWSSPAARTATGRPLGQTCAVCPGPTDPRYVSFAWATAPGPNSNTDTHPQTPQARGQTCDILSAPRNSIRATVHSHRAAGPGRRGTGPTARLASAGRGHGRRLYANRTRRPVVRRPGHEALHAPAATCLWWSRRNVPVRLRQPKRSPSAALTYAADRHRSGVTMSVRIVVIGGMIGQDHIRRITQLLTGGSVTASLDVDAAQRRAGRAGLPGVFTRPRAAQDTDRGVPCVERGCWSPWPGTTRSRSVAGRSRRVESRLFCEKPLARQQDAWPAHHWTPSAGRGPRAGIVPGMRINAPLLKPATAAMTAADWASTGLAMKRAVLLHARHRTRPGAAVRLTHRHVISGRRAHERHRSAGSFG